MKRNSAFLIAASLFLAANLPAQGTLSAERVIQQVAEKLGAVKTLGYRHGFEFSFPSQGRQINQQADAYLDLQPPDRVSKFRFQFTAADRTMTFNGTEQFSLDKKGKKIYVENKPQFKSFGNMFLQNSPLALKYALPRILADSTIAKKVSQVRLADRDRYVIEFSLRKRIINSEGDIVEIRPDLTNHLKLTVDKTTLLPVEVIQTNDKNDETLKTTYTNATEKPAKPNPSSWFFSTYLNDYALQRKDKLTLIEKGKSAPDFSLVGYGSAEKTTLDKFKGKLVLLEFWIAHCGFCISAVPKLNAIGQKYKGIEIVSINMYDPAATIESFNEKTSPEFVILTGGESIATTYGVEAYPAIVLIGRDGKVVYSSSGLEEKELEAAIAAKLKE